MRAGCPRPPPDTASTIAFFVTDWMAGTAARRERTLRASTVTDGDGERSSRHGTARTPSYSASKSAAGNAAASMSTRSAVRSPILHRAMSRSEALKITRLSSARASPMPSDSNSERTTASRPKLAVATHVNRLSLTRVVYS